MQVHFCVFPYVKTFCLPKSVSPSELGLIIINQISTSNNNNNNNLWCQFHNHINVFCHACKQKTHLKASVGNEGELQSLVGLLDPVSVNKMTNKSDFLKVYIHPSIHFKNAAHKWDVMMCSRWKHSKEALTNVILSVYLKMRIMCRSTAMMYNSFWIRKNL